MIGKIVVLFMVGVLGCSLSASEVSQNKIRQITQIIQGEFRKIVVVPAGKKAKAWQLADPGNSRARTPVFAKIKAAVYKKVQARIKPFDTKVKQDPVPQKERAEIKKKVAKRFSYKNPAEIALGALKEAEKAYPLVKVGDDVTIRFYRGGIFSKVSGKVDKIREGGTVYEIGNKIVRVSDIVERDRQYFDPVLNEKLRKEFVEDFQDPKKYAKLKKDYEAYLLAEALEKIVSNEKKGYIFFRDKWVSAKFVTDQLVTYYQGRTDKRLDAEQKFIRGGKSTKAKRVVKKK